MTRESGFIEQVGNAKTFPYGDRMREVGSTCGTGGVRIYDLVWKQPPITKCRTGRPAIEHMGNRNEMAFATLIALTNIKAFNRRQDTCHQKAVATIGLPSCHRRLSRELHTSRSAPYLWRFQVVYGPLPGLTN